MDFEKLFSNFFTNVLLLKKGEKLLIYIDKDSDENILTEIKKYSEKFGIVTDVLSLIEFSEITEMVQAITNKIEFGNYDAICELSGCYFYTTKVWPTAVQNNCRLYAPGPINLRSFERCIGKINHNFVYEFGKVLENILLTARKIEIHSDLGTMLTFKMVSPTIVRKILCKLRLTHLSTVWHPTGLLRKGGSATFLVGQLAFLGTQNSINGIAVIDGFIWPPDDVRHINKPVNIKIKKGHVINIGGCHEKSLILKNWLKGKEKKIMHFCLGFNPGAQISDNLVETERAYGHFNIGIGIFPFHTDAIIKHPRIVIDGKVLLENNSFIHGELAALEKAFLNRNKVTS